LDRFQLFSKISPDRSEGRQQQAVSGNLLRRGGMSFFRFGSFLLDVGERRLLREGRPISLTPKVFDTLAYLVTRHGHLVGKDELLESVWGGAAVEEGSLPRAIHVLRKVLTPGNGDSALPLKYIETVPTKGYRFVAAVTCVDDQSPSSDVQPSAAERADCEAGREASRTSQRVAILMASSVLILVLLGVTWRALDHTGTSRLAGSHPRPAQTVSGAAYARYQSGRLHLERHLPGDVDAAIGDFEAAIQLDGTFAAAYAGKADAQFFRYWTTGMHDDIAQARLAIRTAIASDPNSSYGHAVRCRLLGTYDWLFAEAEAECRRAVDLDPQNHEARRELALLLNAIGQRDEALKEVDAAIAIAPTSFNKQTRGLLLYFNRRFDEAIVQLKQVEATDPEYVESSRFLARCYEQKAEYAQALEVLIRYRQWAGARPGEIALLRQAFGAAGWPRVLRASIPPGRPAPNLETAGTLALLGERDLAFDVLESMISARRVMIVHMDSDPRLDPLRADRRFDQLARRVGLRDRSGSARRVSAQ
jgi:DNA-binding winged helix-turn-helix (wHTH) protein